MKSLPAIFAAVLLTTLLHAQVSVEPLGLSDGPEKPQIQEFHAFGGQTVELDVAVEAPLGSKVSLRLALFQIANKLAAPLGAKSSVPPIDFEKQNRRRVRVAIPLPEVKRQSEVLVRFRAQLGGEEHKTDAGVARLFVYPKDQMRELANSLERAGKDAGISLTVFGESKRIRAFLKANQIPFTDAGSELPGTLKETALFIGEMDAHALAARPAPGGRVIFFSPDPALLPGVYSTSRDSGLFTKVTLPLIDSLATNPWHQRLFIDCLRHGLAFPAAAPAESL